jgi:diaminopimelate decarboxylase
VSSARPGRNPASRDAPAGALDRTPYSVVDLDRVRDGVSLVINSTAPLPVLVTFALKASYLRPVLDAVRHEGAGASVFSEIELDLARRSGFADSSVVYNGCGRPGRELADAAASGAIVNIESMAELADLLSRDLRSPLDVGVRVNSGGLIDGPAEKYEVLGIPAGSLWEFADLLTGSRLRLTGVSFHAFANRRDGDGHLAVLHALLPVLSRLCDHPMVDLRYVDVGGGLASRIDIPDDRAAGFFLAIAETLHATLGVRTIFELGRFLVADAEDVVASVLAVRQRHDGSRVAILDATTNYLIPAPGHDFRIEFCGTSGSDGDPDVNPVTFVDRLGSEICRQPACGLTAGAKVLVRNLGAYAGVMKEKFVFETPRHWFRKDGQLIPWASDEIDVATYHGWAKDADRGLPMRPSPSPDPRPAPPAPARPGGSRDRV